MDFDLLFFELSNINNSYTVSIWKMNLFCTTVHIIRYIKAEKKKKYFGASVPKNKDEIGLLQIEPYITDWA